MEIAEIKQKLNSLGRDIKNLIQQFESETSMRISNVDLERIHSINWGFPLVKVKLQAELTNHLLSEPITFIQPHSIEDNQEAEIKGKGE